MIAVAVEAPRQVPPPTEKQLAILGAIEAYLAEHRCAPSLADLTDVIGVTSRNAVRFHLRRMRAKGWVDWLERTQRSMHVTDEGRRVLARHGAV